MKLNIPQSWRRNSAQALGAAEPSHLAACATTSAAAQKKSSRLVATLPVIFWLLAFTAFSARADEEQDLLAVLNSKASAAAKCDACEKLRLAGSVKSVPALAALLNEKATAHAARYALEGMPFPEALAALRQSAATASGPIKAGLLDSLGWRHDAEAVPLISRSLADADPVVASAAACALGRIGGKAAVEALSAAQKAVPPQVQLAVQDGLCRCADQFLSKGDARQAARIYKRLLNSGVPQPIRIAAWHGTVLADARGRTKMVQEALKGGEQPFHLAALGLLRESKDAKLIKACAHRWAGLPPDAQLAVLDACVGLGGDVSAMVRTATQSPNVSVRVAGWQALANLGDASMVPALCRAAASGDPGERDAARETLTRLRGPGVNQALLVRLDRADAPEQVELLHALGERCEAEAGKVLLGYAANRNESVRLAALDALRRMANPNTAAPLVELAARSASDTEAEPVLKALYAVCESAPDRAQISTAVIEAIKPLPAAERLLVLPLLAELGTPSALELVLSVTRGSDAETAIQGVRVLGQWPTPAPAPNLLEVARTSADPRARVLALRGCMNVVALETDNTKKLALLEQIFSAAQRADEKKQALGLLGQVPTGEALRVAMGYVTDPELSSEAALASIGIAEKIATSDPVAAREAASQLLGRCRNSEIAGRAWALSGRSAGSAPFLQNWQVCGPYRKSGLTGSSALFDVAFGPELAGQAVTWKPMPAGNVADLGGLFPQQFNCVAYLKTRIVSPRDCDAALLLGSDDGVKVWLNGELVHSHNIDRAVVEDQDMAPIHLKEGVNDLLLKITQGNDGWGACARIVAMDGQAIAGLTTTQANP